jgi:hypothetical protein
MTAGDPAPEKTRAAPPFRTRTWALFASGSPRAVILRRGPKRHHRLILWNLENDTFELGQWMKGIVHLCDLTPDAGKLLYWAAQYHSPDRTRRRITFSPDYDPATVPLEKTARKRLLRKRKVPAYLRSAVITATSRRLGETWTAISTPPYFSALAFWPAFGTWTGRGYFAGPCDIALFETADGMTPVENVPFPSAIRLHAVSYRDGYRPSARVPIHAPHDLAMAGGRIMPAQATAELWRAIEDKLPAWLAARPPDPEAYPPHWRQSIDWMSADGADLLVSAEGCIFRVPDGVRSGPHNLAEPRLLIDLTPMRFQTIAPSLSAMSW